MLIKIPLLSFLLFAVCYPLCFWLSFKDPIKNNFHRFHLGCPAVIAGLSVLGVLLQPIDPTIKNMALVWLICFLMLTAYFWRREGVHLLAITVLCLWGMKLFAVLYAHLISPNTWEILISLLAGLIVSTIFYAMNLGHFYLNVHGLNIKHLYTAALTLTILLGLRLLWDVPYIIFGQMIYGGETISVWRFLTTIDGFMLWVALLFGAVFPLGAMFFAFGTLKLKNTQATTGILYVILSSILLGDLTYRYYLIKYNIPL